MPANNYFRVTETVNIARVSWSPELRTKLIDSFPFDDEDRKAALDAYEAALCCADSGRVPRKITIYRPCGFVQAARNVVGEMTYGRIEAAE